MEQSGDAAGSTLGVDSGRSIVKKASVPLVFSQTESPGTNQHPSMRKWRSLVVIKNRKLPEACKQRRLDAAALSVLSEPDKVSSLKEEQRTASDESGNVSFLPTG